ncbi:AIG2-like domain containing protein [Marine Group I thaumarchaeote SCGC AAA799-O18]|nr:AIG2-like domain containing protein [Marine Group I thaumarchaeote SCGC AAA799-O18]
MTIELFVNGTLMRGLTLHKNLDGANFLGEFHTLPIYRLYSIDDIHPGMFEVEEGGVSVAGEMYSMNDEIFQRVKNGEPSGLYFGDVKLNNGSTVKGVLFPREAAESNYKDISNFGDWRAYIASLKK